MKVKMSKKKFVYLVQSEVGLPDNIKDLRNKDSDVIVLSWKKPVQNAIFFPFSTWTEGRNRLLKEVVDTDYLYYIFIDEDIRLEKTDFHKGKEKCPWRLFERLLLDYEPAVGVPDYNWPLWDKAEKEVESTNKFDACVTAIHKNALKVLLPYYDGHDGITWWFSNNYVEYISNLLYPSHILRYNAIKVINKKGRPYPRSERREITNEFLCKSISSPKLKKKFQSFPDMFFGKKVERKNQSYAINRKKLSKLFDLEHLFWKRKHEIFCDINGMKQDSVGYKYPRFQNLGEFMNKHYGVKLTSLFFTPLVFSREIQKSFKFKFFDRTSGRVGIYLKEHFPLIYNKIQKYKK